MHTTKLTPTRTKATKQQASKAPTRRTSITFPLEVLVEAQAYCRRNSLKFNAFVSEAVEKRLAMCKSAAD